MFKGEEHKEDDADEGPGIVTLIVDNYDSFTYNLFHYLHDINGAPPIVVYNNTPWDHVVKILAGVDNIVISPGPGYLTRYFLVRHGPLPSLSLSRPHTLHAPRSTGTRPSRRISACASVS